MSFPDLFQNRLCLPIIAAPLFLASGPELVLACCRSGIVGTFPAKNQRTLAGLEDWLIRITNGLEKSAAKTGIQPAPFGVNLIVHRTNKSLEKELDLCVKYRVPLIITSLGAVPKIIDHVHSYGGIVFHDVINTRHAEKAAAAGADGLIAVAAGAGGHTGLANPFALINEIKKIFDRTVLLSGSISTGSDIAAAQTMGADLAYLGTRFLATRECQSELAYKEMIVNSKLADVTATPAVSGINANFLKPSLKRAGIGIDNTSPHDTLDVDRELADTYTEQPNNFKPWKDIWSAGHGVGSITDIPSVEQLVVRLRAEYCAAMTSQSRKMDYLNARPC